MDTSIPIVNFANLRLRNLEQLASDIINEKA